MPHPKRVIALTRFFPAGNFIKFPFGHWFFVANEPAVSFRNTWNLFFFFSMYHAYCGFSIYCRSILMYSNEVTTKSWWADSVFISSHRIISSSKKSARVPVKFFLQHKRFLNKMERNTLIFEHSMILPLVSWRSALFVHPQKLCAQDYTQFAFAYVSHGQSRRRNPIEKLTSRVQ